MGTLHFIKQWLLGPAFSASSDTGSYRPASYEAGLSAGRVSQHRHSFAEAAHTNTARSDERPIDTNILGSIVELLEPVDWASVHTLARHTGLSHDAIEAHINELNRRGVVGIGERFVPPDRRTVTWITDEARDTGAALMPLRHSSILLDQGAEDHSPDYGGQRR